MRGGDPSIREIGAGSSHVGAEQRPRPHSEASAPHLRRSELSRVGKRRLRGRSAILIRALGKRHERVVTGPDSGIP